VYHLLGLGDLVVALAERADQLVDLVDTSSTAVHQTVNGRALTGSGVVERQDAVSAVCVERAEDTDARVALVTVEPDRLILV